MIFFLYKHQVAFQRNMDFILSLWQEGLENRHHWNKFWRHLPRVEAQVSLCDQTDCWGNKELGEVAFIWALTSQLWPAKRSHPSSSPLGHCWAEPMAEQSCWICIYCMLGAGAFHREVSASGRTFRDINPECLGAAASGAAPASVCKCCCLNGIC